MKTFDEQLADHYDAHAAGTLKSFDEQHQTAVMSGRPWRHVIDANIGQVIIYLTDDEVRDGIATMEATLDGELTSDERASLTERLAGWRAVVA